MRDNLRIAFLKRPSCTAATLTLLAALLAGCGGSSAGPIPTPTVSSTRIAGVATDATAVSTARKFLSHFRRDNITGMLGLMSDSLRRRNRRQFVREMLGVTGAASRVEIVRARSYRGRRHPWTRVTARIEFDHGAVVDRLAVIRTSRGYLVNTITRGAA